MEVVHVETARIVLDLQDTSCVLPNCQSETERRLFVTALAGPRFLASDEVAQTTQRHGLNSRQSMTLIPKDLLVLSSYPSLQ